MASFTFDGTSKLVVCAPGTTSFSAVEVYSRWKEWVAEGDNAKYAPAFTESVGGNDLGGGVRLDAYVFLTNGWRIQPQAADHTLVVEGNIYPEPITAPLFVRPAGDWNILIERYVTNRAVAFSSSGGGSGPTPSEIASAVWSDDPTSYGDGTTGKTLKLAKQAAEVAVALAT